MNAGLKRYSLGIILMLIAGSISAQVNIMFNAVAGGRDLRGLSTVQIMNSGSTELNGTLTVEIRSDAGKILQLSLPVISVRPGVAAIPNSKWSTASTVYSAGEEGNYVRQTGRMPEGELEYCFRFTVRSKTGPDEIFENCFNGTNIISSPLQLTSPANGASVCEKRPRLTWQPPMPLPANTVFAVKLVPVEEGQTPAEAILTNNALVFQPAVRGFLLGYPSNVPELKEGKTYAWQVTTGLKGQGTRSEIWAFTVTCNESNLVDGSYRELKAEDDGGYLKTGSSLKFAVTNPFIAGDLQYSILDLNDKRRAIKKLPAIRLERGDNNITIDLNKLPGLTEGHEYLLSVVLPDGKKVSVRFKYDTSND